MTYTTKQQQAVLRCLRQRPEAVSAGELADALRAEGASVGLATIYRQLDKLEQQGCVHRINTAEGALYQYCPHARHHDCFLLKCLACGRILHADCERLAGLYRHFDEEHHFVVDPGSTVFSGWCSACAPGRKESL